MQAAELFAAPRVFMQARPSGVSMRKALVLAVAALAALAVTRDASAFCGFFINGRGVKLLNQATMVVLMRDGTRTVLSMQNTYAGPPEDFALVVPVPVVLKKENVRTLPRDIFTKVDELAAPRLVEYWEADPCPLPYALGHGAGDTVAAGTIGLRSAGPGATAKAADPYHVKIEAKFTVGEYDIVVLGAEDSLGLALWLKDNGYKMPAGAEPLLRPYVAEGMKFFVAKVDVAKVKFEAGHAVLSPLRFHYDSEDFRLPIRLGLVNSGGAQDLIVHILAKTRFEAANYANVTIPTNLRVRAKTAGHFAEFYAALFDATLKAHPGAAVTEYAWNSATCDPCPGPTLYAPDLMTLGADVLPGATYGLVLTRIHMRYTKASLGEDIVFRKATPIAGGREVWATPGKLERGAHAEGVNNFQARYAIRHAWTGDIACAHPVRGVWGGPPTGYRPPAPAKDLAFAPRAGVSLVSFLREDVPEIGVKRPPMFPKPAAPASAAPGTSASLSAPPAAPTRVALPVFGMLGVLGVCGLVLRRRHGRG
jgi:hypothetical protein